MVSAPSHRLRPNLLPTPPSGILTFANSSDDDDDDDDDNNNVLLAFS